MKRLLYLCFAALAITAFTGVTASIASAENALPGLLFLKGETKETEIKIELTGTMSFNSSFATVTATFILAELFGTNMTSLGLAKVLFKGSKTLGKNCETETEKAKGEVLIDKATWHLVKIPGDGFGILVLIPKTTIKCEGLNFTVEGSVLNPTEPKTATEPDTTSFLAKTECKEKGSHIAKFKEFTSDTGTGTASLRSTSPIAEEVCEEVTGAATATSTEMLEMML
jgi:hypothetical protein